MSAIKPVFKCSDLIDKSTFKTSKCLLTISVGQEAHEGDKFASTIELVNASFGACVLLIDDSLQRYSMALNQVKSPEDFYEASLLAGDAWLARNKKYYQSLTILEDIIRWDVWLEHPRYFTWRQKIQSAIREPFYKACFDETVDTFLNRYYRRLCRKEGFDDTRARKLCLAYLVEECAAFCLWPETGCHYEVYPSQRNLAMAETHQRFVLPTHPHFLHAIGIKFKHRKQFAPQRFSSVEGKDLEKKVLQKELTLNK